MTAPRPVCLVGLRGAGKTTVGRRLAEALGRPFVDLDQAVEGRAGRSLRALFAEAGEAAFRDLEARALRETLELLPGVVVATGGGVVVRADNRDLLGRALVVYLRAAPEVLAGRVAADPATPGQRPALREGGPAAEAAALLAERDALYRSLATAIIDAAAPVDAVVAAVEAVVRGAEP